MGIADSLKRGFRLLSEVIDEGMVFGKKHIKAVIGYQLVSMIAALAAMTVAGIGIFIAMVFVLQYSDIAAFLITAVLLIAGLLVGGTYSMAASLGAIEFIYNGGKKAGYFEGKNVNLAFRWISFWLVAAISVAALAILIALGAVYLDTTGTIGIILAVAAYAVFLLIAILLGIMLYYSNQEIAIKRLGPVAAIKSSIKVFRNNFWETLVFAVLVAVGSALVQIPVAIVVSGITQLIMVASVATAVLAILGIIVAIIGVAIRIAVALLVESAALILKVKFYQKITRAKKKTSA
ncbi:hypothetical protein GF412_01345 [Candidatus Micrarchaeota archaeon]|nr:hypothetical protein [Candidatus Micrarchaeota archaeon]MBD3417616.1 hypothetical protein [Candidatus Micrarchaeota archaeon]